MFHVNLAAGIAFAGLAVTAAPATAAPPVAALPADFARIAAALVDAGYPADGPGTAAIVMREGRVVFARGRGLADVAAHRAITRDTVFRLGSITKQFAAAVILQLVAEGRVSLDDPLSRFLPDFPAPGSGATVRQLLNHSSGIMDYTKIPGWMMSEPTLRPNTTADLIAVIRSRPAVAAPGQRWEYNNGGYVLLGAIIEKVTGRAWHEAVVARIGRPLGLKTVAYAGNAGASPAMAHGYSLVDGKQQPARGVHISVAHAAGGLVASVADLAKWAQALHHGRVVSAALYKEMTSPARLANGATEPYGFGLRLRAVRGRTALVHGGAGRGIDTDSLYLPGDDLFVAVFANTDDPQTDPGVLTRRLAALAIGAPVPSFAPAEVDPRTLGPLFGLYKSETGTPRRFFARDGKVYLGRGDEELPVVPAGGDRFFFGPDELTWFRIVRQAGGAHVMEVHRFETAAPDRAVRSGPVPAALRVADAVLQSYAGTYRTEGPVLTVTLADGRLSIGPDGQEPAVLRAVSDTEFRIDGSPMRVVFHPEGGRADRLTLYRGARELHGQRVTP